MRRGKHTFKTITAIILKGRTTMTVIILLLIFTGELTYFLINRSFKSDVFFWIEADFKGNLEDLS